MSQKPGSQGRKQPERFPKRHRKHREAEDPPAARPPYPQVLYTNMASCREKDDWEGWMHNATETGDPDLWPEILRVYTEQPRTRRVALMHLPFYWQEQPTLVVPLLKEALRDHDLVSQALDAAGYFPGLEEQVVACLKDPELRSRVLPMTLLGSLARLLGSSEEQIDRLSDYPTLGWGEGDPVLHELLEELKRRHSIDVVFLVREY
jgi:hypothetical protein